MYYTPLFQTDTASYSLERYPPVDPERTKAKDASTWPWQTLLL